LSAFKSILRKSYRRDRWADQPRRVEVWSEKGPAQRRRFGHRAAHLRLVL